MGLCPVQLVLKKVKRRIGVDGFRDKRLADAAQKNKG